MSRIFIIPKDQLAQPVTSVARDLLVDNGDLNPICQNFHFAVAKTQKATQ